MRLSRAGRGGIVLGAFLVASCSSPPPPQQVGITLSAPRTAAGSCKGANIGEDLVAETRSGEVVLVAPGNLAVRVVASGARPNGGVAERAKTSQVYVTARLATGVPAIWAISLSGCRSHARLVETWAELPSVSPDGDYLGFVNVDGRGRQTGVSIAKLDDAGDATGTVERLNAASVPPPLPIQGIAIGMDDRQLAVWGGFIDQYLGRHRPTVGVLVPATARSLHSLAPVFDGEGVSLPSGAGLQDPKIWETAPSYLANGEFLVQTNDKEVVMPFTDTTPGESGGGTRNIERMTGDMVSLAAGPSGALASVGQGGVLQISRGAIDLPFGPEAEFPVPPPTPVIVRVKGAYAAVAWSTGTSPESMRPPPVFKMVDHLPNVVGLPVAKAKQVLTDLALPMLVENTVPDAGVPSGTVLSENPPAGTGVACQCDISVVVSSKQ